jgi:methylated-DNA-[protein]-cysteine S-methyltransferase
MATGARGRQLPDGSAWGEVDSPVGPLTIVATPDGLLRLAFGHLRPNTTNLHTHNPPCGLAAHPVGAVVVRELTEYFEGTRQAFEAPLDWSLTAGAHRSILETLYTRVSYGATLGYGDLARLSGRTVGASRLVGTAMGGNPIAIIVPCHRVVAGDGGLGGFGGGPERKRKLLTLEGALPPGLFEL